MRRPRTFLVCLFVSLLVAVVLTQSKAGEGAASDPALLARLRNQIPGRDLSLEPPRVHDAVIEPLLQPVPEGNVILRVRFAEDEVLPERLEFLADDRVAALSDDGTGVDDARADGVYSAVGTVDVAELSRSLSRLARASNAQPTSTFRSRAKVPTDARLDSQGLRPGVTIPWEPWGDPSAIDAERMLLIRDPQVVQDPTRTRASCGGASMGPWSFGHLMNRTFWNGRGHARRWLEELALSRPLIRERLLDPWIAASGGPDAELDLSRAPFRLLAIVNRFDLRSGLSYGGDALGELRFVFTAMSETCAPLPNFTVIFEYGVPSWAARAFGGCRAQAWAQRWKDLEAHPVGSAAYNTALELLTERVLSNATETFGQLRTNENAFDSSTGGRTWEMLQFKPHRDLGIPTGLGRDPVSQTPSHRMNGSKTLDTHVNRYAEKIRAGVHRLGFGGPDDIPRGWEAPYSLRTFWDGTRGGISDREARHRFSLATCSGCHAAETRTEFMHIRPAGFGEQAELSGFLTGIAVSDAADGTPTRFFSDLERRATDLDALLATPCFLSPLDTSVKMAH